MSPENTDVEFLSAAYRMAAQYSPDPSSRNAALLVDFSEDPLGRVVASGINEFPRDVESRADRWQRPLKYQFVEHAERNAIFAAARTGIKTTGLTMYCPWSACTDCARAIIQAGITELVRHRFEGDGHEQWAESIALADVMMREARVSIRDVWWLPPKQRALYVLRNGTWMNLAAKDAEPFPLEPLGEK